MKEKSLVILAAGMGSRFGGMKQVEPIGPNGEFIMDYSIYSAIKYGFTKIIFVIRKEYLGLFKNSIEKRIGNKIKIAYVFQELNDIPDGFEVPKDRIKPWGTAHALYCARNEIEGNFGLISADDFYGDNAFKQLAKALDEDVYSIIGYPIEKTLSDNGSVKRAVINSDNGDVSSLIESSCEKIDGKIVCKPLNKNIKEFIVEGDKLVSMLMLGFTKTVIEKIENDMIKVFEENKNNLTNYEMLLPDIVDDSIKEGCIVKVVPTSSIWIGMTYKDDKVIVQDFIKKEIKSGVYKEKLWD